MLSQIKGEGTDYEQKTTYTYLSNPTDPTQKRTSIGTCIVQNTTGGATVHNYYDGEQKVLANYLEDEHGILRKVAEKKYDNQGREVLCSQLDYVVNESGTVEKTLTNSVMFVYDLWGNTSEKQHNDGTIELTIQDPINLIAT